MTRYIFAQNRSSRWRRALRAGTLIFLPVLLLSLAGGGGLLLATRMNELSAEQVAGAASLRAGPALPLPNVAAADPRERQFLAVEIARDACKQAVLARMPHPTRVSRTGFYQAAVTTIGNGGRRLLRVTGVAKPAWLGAASEPPTFSCDVKNGEVVRLALQPPPRTWLNRPG